MFQHSVSFLLAIRHSILQYQNRVDTTAKQNKNNENSDKVKSRKLPVARENKCDRVTIGSSFVSDWLRGWRESS